MCCRFKRRSVIHAFMHMNAPLRVTVFVSVFLMERACHEPRPVRCKQNVKYSVI